MKTIKISIFLSFILGIMLSAFSFNCHADLPDVEVKHGLTQIFNNDISVPIEYPYKKIILHWAKQRNLPEIFVAAVARAESFFEEKAVSSKGAMGIMQIMPSTAEMYGFDAKALFDPGVNIEAGTKILKDLIDSFQDPYRALAAYYCGKNALVDGKIPKAGSEYAGYVYNHLLKLKHNKGYPAVTSSESDKEFIVMTFNRYTSAKGLVDLIKSKSLLNVSVLENKAANRYSYSVILLSGKSMDINKACDEIMQITGFEICRMTL